MDFNKSLDQAIDDLTRYEIDIKTEEYKKTYDSLTLMETTKIRTGHVLTELTARDLITRMAMLAKREQRGLRARDLQRVIQASLRSEKFGGGDQAAIDQETQTLMNDPGVVQSIHHELKRMGVEFYY